MSRSLLVVVVLGTACNIDLSGVCLFDARSGAALRVLLEDQNVDGGSADRMGSTGRGVVISGAIDAGRLALSYDGPLISEGLPASRSGGPDAGACSDTGDFAFLLTTAPDASTALTDVVATVSVTQLDAGLFIHCSQMTIADGGTALPDRDFTF